MIRKPSRSYAVTYVASVLRHARDWQDGQHALSNHPTLGPWLDEQFGDGALMEIQAIIREAEDRLGDELPY